MKKSPIALAVAGVCLFSNLAMAQSQSLPEVTVTASPVIDSNNTDVFGSYSTWVSADQIQDLNAVDLASALRRTPGVSISRFNPVGSYGGEEGGAVHIRGMGTTRPGSEIKTYIDDVPFYMGVWNHPLLDLLPINGMSRVEVVKGTQPQRYGNNFGAINLVPKQAGPTEGVQGDVQLSAGSFQTVVEQFDLVGRNGDWDYALAQGYAKSEGHREFADGKLSNVMGQLGLRMSKEWSIRWLMLQADNTAGDPGHITTLAGRGDTYATKGHMVSVSLAIISPALLLALSMAAMRAPCSEALLSSRLRSSSVSTKRGRSVSSTALGSGSSRWETWPASLPSKLGSSSMGKTRSTVGVWATGLLK